MSAKHTPGPWSVDGERYYVRDDRRGELVADCYTFTETDMGRVVDASCAANARLIAAAPELLEALKDLAEAARNACDARQHPALTEALAAADYAVIKAEGREP